MSGTYMPHFLLEANVRALPDELQDWLHEYWSQKFNRYLAVWGCNKEDEARRHANGLYWETARYYVDLMHLARSTVQATQQQKVDEEDKEEEDEDDDDDVSLVDDQAEKAVSEKRVSEKAVSEKAVSIEEKKAAVPSK